MALRSAVQIVSSVQLLRSVQSPTFFLPRVAGEDAEGGLIDLNVLNVLNDDGIKLYVKL